MGRETDRDTEREREREREYSFIIYYGFKVITFEDLSKVFYI